MTLLDDGIDYYTQTNNKLDPRIACQCTAAVQCLAIIHELRHILGPFEQPEDNLRHLCDASQPLVKKEAEERSINLHSVEHPSEYLTILVAVINAAVGYEVAKFGYVPAEGVLRTLQEGHPFQARMVYRIGKRNFGHHVSIVGYDQSNFVINDPFGDMRINSSKVSGRHLVYTQAEFNSHYNRSGIIYNKLCGGMH